MSGGEFAFLLALIIAAALMWACVAVGAWAILGGHL
jgi:hypothetical protein